MTREQLEQDRIDLTAQRDQLLAQVNMVVGALQYNQQCLDRFATDPPQDAPAADESAG